MSRTSRKSKTRIDSRDDSRKGLDKDYNEWKKYLLGKGCDDYAEDMIEYGLSKNDENQIKPILNKNCIRNNKCMIKKCNPEILDYLEANTITEAEANKCKLERQRSDNPNQWYKCIHKTRLKKQAHNRYATLLNCRYKKCMTKKRHDKDYEDELKAYPKMQCMITHCNKKKKLFDIHEIKRQCYINLTKAQEQRKCITSNIRKYSKEHRAEQKDNDKCFTKHCRDKF